MLLAIGFVIALAVGLTGIGGGSFTVPALILFVGLAPKTAVGTAFIFAGVLRLIVGPLYLWGKQVRGAYVWGLLKGAVPGLLIGTYLLRLLSENETNPVLVIALGILLAASSSLTFVRCLHNPEFARKNARWLPWFALPIGIESGFSSAGAGALGTVLLLNYSEMTPSEVVGTDLLFGLGLAAIGSAIHLKFGSVSSSTLLQLLSAGIPGVLLGFVLARRTPARNLKSAIALIAILAGMQLVWTGSRSLVTASAQQRTNSVVSSRTTRSDDVKKAIRRISDDLHNSTVWRAPVTESLEKTGGGRSPWLALGWLRAGF
ncbi:MAG: permease [Acidobacteria bacterium]|nr:MAG: permease [Acidobacteriota bacterium]